MATVLSWEEQERRRELEAQPVELVDLRAAQGDVGVWAFGLLALLALVVSVPETYKVMALYHNTTLTIGLIQSVAGLLVFELGAIISKAATLWFPEWRGG